jgi:hypothetical protein
MLNGSEETQEEAISSLRGLLIVEQAVKNRMRKTR